MKASPERRARRKRGRKVDGLLEEFIATAYDIGVLTLRIERLRRRQECLRARLVSIGPIPTPSPHSENES